MVDPKQTNNLRQAQGFAVIEALIIIVILTVLGAVGWYVYHAQTGNKNQAASTAGSKVAASDTNTSATIIAGVQRRLATQYALKETEAEPTASQTLTYQKGTASPAWQPQGVTYAVTVPNGHEFSAAYFDGSHQPNNANYNAIQAVYKSVLSSNGFTKAKTVDGVTATYLGSDAVCAIDSGEGNPTSIRCAQLGDYALQAKKIKPFADAYPDPTGIIFMIPATKDSKTVGYKIANIGIGYKDGESSGARALFFSKDGAWHYFHSTQEELACDSYNTHDIRLAYAGEGCIDTSNNNAESTVQPS